MNGEKDRTLALGKEEPESASDTGVPATIGRLRIERLLGQGGMAQVFRAFDPLLGRPVAVKLMYGESPDQNLRLIREARLLAKVDHPHICKIYETGLEGSRPYIVMQLVDGRVLDVAAADLSLTEKLHLFITIAEAVHAAHRIGLIHRDLKPANILVETRPGDPPHPYVLDFGLARELEGIDATATGMITGSPAFMSPEQARGDRALMDTRTDVYGLGATFYSVLSGRLPFDAPTPFETLLKVVSEEPAPLRRAAPRIPADL
ncbi:MAG: serine/threonine protein kinase, partial [Acidobacteria bacterium]|nr:serine/threonine protein kinase [Acidobacteriota bacterium]